MDRLSRFSWLVLGYNVAVILWGAVVRATGSGAGVRAHWPLCDGAVIPRSPRVETLIELSHRLSSGLALVLVVALAVWAFRARPKGHAARRGAVAAVILILVEAGVGAGLVLFRLVAANAVDGAGPLHGRPPGQHVPAAGSAHAHGALVDAPSEPPHAQGRGHRLARPRARRRSVLAGASGAVAALGDTLFPARSWAEALSQDLSPTGHVLVRLRLLHPAIALASGLLLLYVACAPRAGCAPRGTELVTVGHAAGSHPARGGHAERALAGAGLDAGPPPAAGGPALDLARGNGRVGARARRACGGGWLSGQPCAWATSDGPSASPG